MPSLSVAAAILAGGRARRMDGADKGRLIVEGRAIIVRQLDALRGLTPDILIVANDADRFADLDVPVVADAYPDAGALGGLCTALVSARTDWVIVVGCDMPFITTGALERLAAAARSGDGDGAWAYSGRGVEPLFACYRTASSRRLQTLLARGERRLSAAAEVLDMRGIDVAALADGDAAARLLTNINTPEDYARVQ